MLESGGSTRMGPVGAATRQVVAPTRT
jgi:hypothetical protein